MYTYFSCITTTLFLIQIYTKVCFNQFIWTAKLFDVHWICFHFIHMQLYLYQLLLLLGGILEHCYSFGIKHLLKGLCLAHTNQTPSPVTYLIFDIEQVLSPVQLYHPTNSQPMPDNFYIPLFLFIMFS